MKYFFGTLLLFAAALHCYAQNDLIITGKIIDHLTKEPLVGAVISDAHNHLATSNAAGNFSLKTIDETITVSFTNYKKTTIPVFAKTKVIVNLQQDPANLPQVVVSANRTAQKRSEAPIAISIITKQTLEDTKANMLDQVLNKASGVFMVNLGNEQHEMSIRQPMTTRSLFLYLEDGVPIRTTGLYNHNALLEMNMAAAKSIEIIKGPASSLYGAEAIGGAVNIITQAPPAVSAGKINLQWNNNGYKRIDAQMGNTYGKFGFLATAYYANRNNGPIDQTNYHKTAITFRGDYKFSNKTIWSNTLTYIDYYSQMGGGSLDSTKFANHDYGSLYNFNYRAVNALRIKSQLNYQWNNSAETQAIIAFRNNSTKQNPSYYLTNNPTNPLMGNGQINNSSFASYLFIIQHQQKFNFLNSKLIAGISGDISPSTYMANYIKVQRGATGSYINFTGTDSTLSNYSTGIENIAAYANYNATLIKGLKLTAALRYDLFHYDFKNSLPGSAATGAPNTVSDFYRFTPKVGLTFNYKNVGFYSNYSQGFVAPQVGELFNSVKVPYLDPQTFFNYELGGWVNLLNNKIYADYSIYRMDGTNEIISVRQNDGSYVNQNSGQTRHQGIEYGVTYKPAQEWTIRFSGTNAKHTFINDIEKGINYSGNEMGAAPHFIANAEVTYKPAFIAGLRMGVEWQHQGNYYLDNANSGKYPGFNVLNARLGYNAKQFEFWLNALNLFNKYYSVLAIKSTYGYAYQLGDPREITLGVGYRFGH